MKIEIQVSDITLFAKAFNNALVSYGDILSSLRFGLEVPSKYDGLASLSQKELDDRFNELKQVYFQVENIEKEYNK